MDENHAAFNKKYPWAASRTITVGISDEHPFLATAYRSARKHHLIFRQKQYQAAFLQKYEKTRRSMLKKSIEINDRHALSLRIHAAITPGHPFLGEKHRKGLSTGGVRRWIEGIDDKPLWEEEEDRMYDPNVNRSITALQMH